LKQPLKDHRLDLVIDAGAGAMCVDKGDVAGADAPGTVQAEPDGALQSLALGIGLGDMKSIAAVAVAGKGEAWS